MCTEDETQNHICNGYTETHSKSSHKPSRIENRAVAVFLTWSNERLKLVASKNEAEAAHAHICTPDLTIRNQGTQVMLVTATCPDKPKFTTSEALPLVFLMQSQPLEALLCFMNNNFLHKKEALKNWISRKESMKSCSNRFQSSHSVWQRGL